ncbi:protein SRC2-like [Cornus florida]|uniref:protein SRC2-like n=1 Tax=Cornus florida TaxID=4283 RepID=UPI00289A452A|nr:protein SRC2-like [Cornus florida]
MAYHTLDITIISAEGLDDVNLVTKMDVYVVASISGVRKLTRADKHGGTKPKWNHHMNYFVAESALQKPDLCLTFTLRSDRVLGDKDIGYVYVPLPDLLAGNTTSERVVEYPVQKPPEEPKGTLKFSYKYDGKFTPPHTAAPAKAHEPVTAYPASVDSSKAGAAAQAKVQEPVTVHPPNISVSTTVAQPARVAMAYPRPPYTYPPQQAAGGFGYPPLPQEYPVPAMAGYGYP